MAILIDTKGRDAVEAVNGELDSDLRAIGGVHRNRFSPIARDYPEGGTLLVIGRLGEVEGDYWGRTTLLHSILVGGQDHPILRIWLYIEIEARGVVTDEAHASREQYERHYHGQ